MHTLEEDRLEAALDTQRTVEYEGSSYQYQPRFQWGTGDFDTEYPSLVLDYNTEGAQRDADQPLNDLINIEEKPNESDYEFHEGSRVQDDLQAQVVTEYGYDENDVPGHVVAQQLTMSVWKTIRFNMNLNTVGANGESPMLFEVAGSPSGPGRDGSTVRSTFVFRAKYMIPNVRSVDSVADAETDANIN